jgi:hypothetical protein
MKIMVACFLTLLITITFASCTIPERPQIALAQEDNPQQENKSSSQEDQGQTKNNPPKDTSTPNSMGENLNSFSDDLLFPYKDDDGWGYIDSKGNMVIQGYWGVNDFQGEYAVVQTGMKSVSLIDRTGKRLLTEIEDINGSINDIEVMDDFALIRINAGYAAIVKLPEGKVIVDNHDVWFIPWSKEGFCTVRKDGLSGYINLNGQMIIEPVYQCAGEFRNNVALVQTTEGKIRLIDTEGKTVVEDFTLDVDKYGYVIEQCAGEYIVVCDKTTSLIGLYQAGTGMILPCEYANITMMSNGQIMAGNRQYQYSLFTPEGKELVSGYSSIIECGTGFYAVMDQSEKVKLMNQFGKEIYEFRYFRYPNNVHWDGKNTFFYYNSDKTIIVVDSEGKELAWITSPYNSEYSADFRFINGLILMFDFERFFDSAGTPVGGKEYCEYFTYTGEKVEFK